MQSTRVRKVPQVSLEVHYSYLTEVKYVSKVETTTSQPSRILKGVLTGSREVFTLLMLPNLVCQFNDEKVIGLRRGHQQQRPPAIRHSNP